MTLIATLAGCVTTPAPDAPTPYASDVGDRAATGFNEIIVSLPLKGSNAAYQNLHVGLAVLANPTRQTQGSPHELRNLIDRLDGRVRARLIEVLYDTTSNSGSQSVYTTAELRRSIVAEAQAIVDAGLRQWVHAADYKVEVVLVSLYWTDGSVGQTSNRGMGWWGY
jgi:hypothetical protein